MRHTIEFYIILGLALAFTLGNALTEYVNRATLNPLQQPLSAYLTAPKLGWLQSLCYLGFAAALPLTAVYFDGPLRERIAFYIAGGALEVVVGTKWIIKFNPDIHDAVEEFHVISAGIAFLCCSLGLYFHNEGTKMAALIWIPIVTLLVTVFFWDSIERDIVRVFGVVADKQSMEEKVYTFPLIMVFLATLLT